MEFSIITGNTECSGLHSFVEEIFMCIETMQFEQIGDITAGQANGNRFIGTTSISADEIVNTLKNDISQNTLGANEYDFDIDVKFAKGTIRDIIVIDISVYDDNNNTLTTSYQIK